MRDSKKLNTPLHLAASRGHASSVAYLLKKNADPQAVNKSRCDLTSPCVAGSTRPHAYYLPYPSDRKTPVDLASTAEVRQAFAKAAGSSEEPEAQADAEPEARGTSVGGTANTEAQGGNGGGEKRPATEEHDAAAQKAARRD